MTRRLSGFLGLLALAAVLTAAPARAGTVTCTRTAESILTTMYLVVGSCTLSSSYATNGDTFGSGNTLAQAGAALCGSPQKKPLVVLFEATKGGNLFDFDHTNRTVKAFRPVGAIAAHTHNLHLNNADVADGATTRINAGADLLGANTGADLLVTGVADTSGVGGIVAGGAVAQAAGAEVTAGVNLSTTTLRYLAICA